MACGCQAEIDSSSWRILFLSSQTSIFVGGAHSWSFKLSSQYQNVHWLNYVLQSSEEKRPHDYSLLHTSVIDWTRMIVQGFKRKNLTSWKTSMLEKLHRRHIDDKSSSFLFDTFQIKCQNFRSTIALDLAPSKPRNMRKLFDNRDIQHKHKK